MTLDVSLPQAFQAVLDKDEKVLWAGKPAGLPFLISGIPFLFFGCCSHFKRWKSNVTRR